MGHRARGLGVVGLLLLWPAAPALVAQVAPLSAPRGALRVELGGAFESSRTTLPSNVDGSEVTAQVDRGIGVVGIGLGLTDRLTIFGRMPAVRVRVQSPAVNEAADDAEWGLGDAEAGIAFTLVDQWDRADRLGGVRIAVEGLARFPTAGALTGARAGPMIGSGQTDGQLRVVTDLGAGRIGVRVAGTYVRQFGTGPGGEELFDIAVVSARPFVRLTPSFAAQLGVEQIFRSTAEGGRTTSILGGVSFYGRNGLPISGTGMPLAASWTVEKAVATSFDDAPEPLTIRVALALYWELF